MKNKWFLILITIMFAIVVNNANAEWDWRENLKKFNNGVKNTTERVKRGTQKAKGDWKSRERECSVCGKIIHFGTKCKSCQARIIKRKSKEFGRKVKKKTVDVKRAWDDGRENRKYIYNSIKKEYNQTLKRIRDPETRRKATETISTIVKIRQKIRETKMRGVNKGFDMLAKIPIKGTTLGELAREKLSRKFPELGRSGMFDDPAETATALICHDSNFFLNEVDIIQKNGRNISVCEAISESSSFNANKTIGYLRVAGAVEGIASADDVGGAMIGVFNAIDAASR